MGNIIYFGKIFKGCENMIIFADRHNDTREIQELVAKSFDCNEVMCFTDKPNLLNYMDKFSDNSNDIQTYTLIFKLVETNYDNVMFAKKLIDEYEKYAIIFIISRKSYFNLLVDGLNINFNCIFAPITAEKIENSIANTRKIMAFHNVDTIMISTRGGDTLLHVDEIDYCESFKRIVYFHTGNDVQKMYTKLTDIENVIPNVFGRCHQSYLVNLRHIKSVGRITIELMNGKTVPLAQRRRKAILDSLKLISDGHL
jgi:DNA-binding LytR/AlgR family response regulator